MTKSNFGTPSPLYLQCKTWSRWPKVPTWEGKVVEQKQKQMWNQWTTEHALGACKIGFLKLFEVRILIFGSAWSCLVLIKNDNKKHLQKQGVPAPGDWACALWPQQHSVINFFRNTLYLYLYWEKRRKSNLFNLSLFVYFCYCGSGATILGRRSSGHNGGQSATAQILQ